MSGCFGNSAYDREMERQLAQHLDATSLPECCEGCVQAENCPIDYEWEDGCYAEQL